MSGTHNAGTCPDDARCWHECETGCFRVTTCGPLSGVYPEDRWPEEVVHAHTEVTFAPDRDTTEAAFDQVIIDTTSRGRGYGKSSGTPALPCDCGEPESPGIIHRSTEPCRVDLSVEHEEATPPDVTTLPNRMLCDACVARKTEIIELRGRLAELTKTIRECASANDGRGWRR